MTQLKQWGRLVAKPMNRSPEIAAVIVILIAAIVVFALTAPGFFQISNMSILIQQGAMLAIATMGMSLVILIEEIDLSIGSVMAVAGVATGMTLVSGVGIVPSIAVGLLVGLAAGLFNGLVIAATGLNSFVVTFGMFGMARGLALVLSDGFAITGFPDSFAALFQSDTFGIPFAFWVVAVVVGLTYVLLHHTSFGTSLFAIGCDMEIARLAGIRVLRNKVIVFSLSGLFAGLAGIMVMARLNAAHPGSGAGYEFDAIAAAVVGGIPLSGGRGKVLGALAGAFIITILRNGMSIMGIGLYWQLVVIGLVFILAYTMQSLRSEQL